MMHMNDDGDEYGGADCDENSEDDDENNDDEGKC